jgi:hypothetical protein
MPLTVPAGSEVLGCAGAAAAPQVSFSQYCGSCLGDSSSTVVFFSVSIVAADLGAVARQVLFRTRVGLDEGISSKAVVAPFCAVRRNVCCRGCGGCRQALFSAKCCETEQERFCAVLSRQQQSFLSCPGPCQQPLQLV